MTHATQEPSSHALDAARDDRVAPWPLYVAAVCLCTIAFGITVSFPWHISKLSVGFVFLVPVLLMARAGGFGPAALAWVLAGIADLHFFAPNHLPYELTRPELLLVAQFASAGLVISALGEWVRAPSESR